MRRPRAVPPDSLFEQREPQHVRRFRLAGEPLRFETDDQRVMGLAAALFERYGPAPEGGEPLRLRVLVGAPDDRVTLAARPVYRTHAHLFTVALGAHDTGAADLLAGHAFAAVSEALVADGWRLQHQVMAALALSLLGPARGYVPLHCACLVKDGRGVLLHGSAGAGKSTLAYAAARRGYRVVSDDSVHVGGDGDVRAWGLPWQFQLLPDAKRFFPELEGLEPRVHGDGEAKLDLDLECLLPGSVAVSGPLGPSLLLTRRPGATKIERLTEAEALRAIEPAWPWQVGWTERHEELLSTVVRRGVYSFSTSAGPDALVDALDAFVEGPWD